MTDPAPTITQADEKLALELLELAGDLFEIEAGDKAVPEFMIRIARYRESARRDALKEAARAAEDVSINSKRGKPLAHKIAAIIRNMKDTP